MSTITTERLTKILSETKAVITECNSRGVHGSVEVNASLFENVLMELLRRRAAMLQGAENAESTTTMQTAPELDYSPKNAESPTGINQGKSEPVTTAYKLPANTPCKEAPEHIWLQTAGVWPENGEFSELTWCSDNQHTDDTLYVRADVVTGNSPVIPDEVLSAVRKVACIREDFDDFDGDRRGIGDCLDEAGQELIVTINKYASVLAAAPQRDA